MKSFFLSLVMLLGSDSLFAGEIEKDLKPFTRIIASPRIHVILNKGEKEGIRLVYNDVNESRINILVKGKTLHLFLDDARKVERTVRDYDNDRGSRQGMYEGASITAYVTYKHLEMLEIRGSQEITCYDELSSPEFRLRAYGENEINLAALETSDLRVALYGRNKLTVNSGTAMEQRYRLYGENKINTQNLNAEYTSTSIFGEGKLRINSSEEVKVDAFGEPRIYVDGGGFINRRLIFGRTRIYKN